MLNLRSKLRSRLLGYFFTNPSAEPYLRELAAILQADPANLSRELAALERQGLFASRARGKEKYWRLRRDFPLYDEYRRIVFKTVGVAGQLREALNRIPGIEAAWLYGSFAKNQADSASDIDVLVVGKPDAERLEEAVGRLERSLKREINYTVLAAEEFKKRRKADDAFVEDVLAHPHIPLIGTL